MDAGMVLAAIRDAKKRLDAAEQALLHGDSKTTDEKLDHARRLIDAARAENGKVGRWQGER